MWLSHPEGLTISCFRVLFTHVPCRVVSQQAHLDAVITVLETSTYTLMNVSNEFRHGKTLVVLGRVVADVLDVTVAQMRARLDDATALAR